MLRESIGYFFSQVDTRGKYEAYSDAMSEIPNALHLLAPNICQARMEDVKLEPSDRAVSNLITVLKGLIKHQQ